MRGPLPLAALLLLPAFAGCTGAPAALLDSGVLEGPSAPAHPPWAAPESAVVRPGVPLKTQDGECPTSFVFTRPDNGTVFVATTAWCVRRVPVGGLATIGDGEHLAVLAYSSYATMDELGERDPVAREYNDFAVFAIDSSSRPDVSPAIRGAGGPVGLADAAALRTGDRVVAVGEGSPAARRDALVTGRMGEWALLVHGAPPTLPGAMGSPVLTPGGEAVGVVVNLAVTPVPGANGVARLDALMRYAAEHARLDMRLATWDLLDEGGL